MRKKLLLSSATLAAAFAAGIATPASATIVLCGPNLANQCPQQGANVLFNAGVQQDTQVEGFTQSGTEVRFTGTTNSTTSNPDLIVAQGGQARIEGTDNTATVGRGDSYLLTDLSFSLAPNADGSFNFFDNLTLALQGGTATTVNFTFVDNFGNTEAFAPLALGNGNTFFRFDAIHGQAIASVTMTFGGAPAGVVAGIEDVSQIRLDDVELTTAVPEPATWAMMLIGFGAVGYSMRSRKVGYKALQAV
jgi:hypothetical protein